MYDGKGIFYYEDESSSEGKFKNDKMIDDHTFYHSQGQKIINKYHKDGILISR